MTKPGYAEHAVQVTPNSGATPWSRWTVVVVAATAAGGLLAWPWGWLTLAAMFAIAAAYAPWKYPRFTILDHRTEIVLAGLIAATAAVRIAHVPANSIERFLTADGQLAEVEGTITSRPRITPPSEGFFADFAYERPRTLTTLRVDRIARDEERWESASGHVLIKLDEAESTLEVGDHVRMLGWLGDVGPTKNPGEFGYREWLADRGVRGRLTVRTREHAQVLKPTADSSVRGLTSFGNHIGDALARTLAEGIEGQPQRLALLEALLLGRGESGMGDLRETFRRVGLAHVLSISGAHFGILVLLAWGLARAASSNPRLVAWLVLAAILAYAAILPGRVPIIRATIMAVAYFGPAALGRAISGRDALCLAAVAVLLWQPQQLFTPGFQLSFVAVAAILLYTPTVAEWIWPKPLVPLRHVPGWYAPARATVNYLAVSIVAFFAVLPLIVFHFGMVSPWAILLSMLAWPALFAVLALGYLKMLVGWLLPSAGLLLAGPLGWAVDALVTLAERAVDWPGATWRLLQPIDHGWGVLWTLATLGFVAAWFGGRFRWRRKLGVAAAGTLLVGLALMQDVSQRWLREPPAASISMIAVGDGSCFVLQSQGQTLVFDCGSQGYDRVGERSAVPALRSLGVRHIDLLVISHADLDHFSGVPELIDALPVRRIVCSPEVFADAANRPDAATARLLAWLNEIGKTPEPITAGWSLDFGHARLEALWPPPGLVAPRSNDHSVLLRIEAAGRTALLHGDLQQTGKLALLDDPELIAKLDADVTDLPHHGSFVDASPDWLDAVSPTIVLQSSGPDRLRFDRWLDPLAQRDIRRFVSHTAGLTTINIHPNGRLETSTLLKPAAP
ncbi:MAG: ComEC/Rec2 family competence protein [Planctomycetota bacterium]